MILLYKPLQNQPYFIALGGSEFDLFSTNHQSAPNINQKRKKNFQFTVNAETKKEALKI